MDRTRLTPTQTRLLTYLESRRGQLVTKDELVDHLWLGARLPEDPAKVFDVHMHDLRAVGATIETVTAYRLPRR